MKRSGRSASFDIVYSWGVLHHTGEMWHAIENAASLVKPGGLMWIAIYNRADGVGLYSDQRVGSSRFWEREKVFYNRLPKMGQQCDGLQRGDGHGDRVPLVWTQPDP